MLDGQSRTLPIARIYDQAPLKVGDIRSQAIYGPGWQFIPPDRSGAAMFQKQFLTGKKGWGNSLLRKMVEDTT